MKILFVNFPYAGHTLPTLPIVEKLVKNGHNVTYVNHEKWREKILSTGAKFVPCIDYLEKVFNIDTADTFAFKALYNTALNIEEKFDILMYEFMFFQGNFLAKQLNIPAIRFCSSFAYSDKVTQEFSLNCNLWKLVQSPIITGIGTMFMNNGIPYSYNNYVKAMTYDYPDLNIIFTCEDFQVDNKNFNKDKFKFIGTSANNNYINSQTYKDKGVEFLNKNNISKEKTLIYISMGTLMRGTYKFLKKCIETFKDKDVTVIISAGTSYKKIKKINTAKNIFIYDYVPQLELLSHVDLFITHGGMNSINESMFLGIPMLVVPVAFDQCTNAKLIEQYNIGLKGNLKKISSTEIWEKSNYILNNSEIQSNIKEWQQKQIDAGGVQRAVDEIEKYFRKITEK